jgi:hypothetical protein
MQIVVALFFFCLSQPLLNAVDNKSHPVVVVMVVVGLRGRESNFTLLLLQQLNRKDVRPFSFSFD